jgi:hypothetical protein
MNIFVGKRKLFLLVFSFLLLANVRPERNPCPADVQMGEVNLTIPAEEMAGTTEVQIVRCSGMNLQVTAGMMLQTPVVANGIVHHDSLILTVHLLEPEPGPVDVTVWWRVE